MPSVNQVFCKNSYFRYLKNNKPYLCEDKTKYCNRWKDNGICFLNKTFIPR